MARSGAEIIARKILWRMAVIATVAMTAVFAVFSFGGEAHQPL